MARRQRSWEGKKFTKSATNTGGTVKVRDFSKPKPKPKAAPKKSATKRTTPSKPKSRPSTGGPARHRTNKSSTGGPARHKKASPNARFSADPKPTPKKRVPGRALIHALSNAINGKGATNAGAVAGTRSSGKKKKGAKK